MPASLPVSADAYLQAHSVAHWLLDDIAAELDHLRSLDGTIGGTPCRSYVADGEPAWDNCCESSADPDCVGGQLAIWLQRVYPVGRFPNPQGDALRCPFPLGMELRIDVVRCAPSVSGSAAAPSVDAIHASARRVQADQLAVMRALATRFGSRSQVAMWHTTGSTSHRPQGGCVGSMTPVTVQAGACT